MLRVAISLMLSVGAVGYDTSPRDGTVAPLRLVINEMGCSVNLLGLTDLSCEGISEGSSDCHSKT